MSHAYNGFRGFESVGAVKEVSCQVVLLPMIINGVGLDNGTPYP